jgi:hypothetical protein
MSALATLARDNRARRRIRDRLLQVGNGLVPPLHLDALKRDHPHLLSAEHWQIRTILAAGVAAGFIAARDIEKE